MKSLLLLLLLAGALPLPRVEIFPKGLRGVVRLRPGAAFWPPLTQSLFPLSGGGQDPQFYPCQQLGCGGCWWWWRCGGAGGSFSPSFSQNLNPPGPKAARNQQKQKAESPQPPFPCQPLTFPPRSRAAGGSRRPAAGAPQPGES